MSKRIDLTGQRFGRWTVVKYLGCKNDKTLYQCRCDCGTEKELDGRVLRDGRSKSCGCYDRDVKKSRYIDITNQSFGSWTVLKKSQNKNNHVMWLCRCDCGTERDVASTQLLCGASTSCGCKRIQSLKDKFTKHGKRYSRLYSIYHGMLKRCFNQNNKAYSTYGALGITVCQEWLGENGFENFYNWAMQNNYSDDLSIDRIDYNGNYEPSNCRWATDKQQSNNRSTNVYITRDGVTHTMSEWCDIFGLNYSTVNRRRQLGWSEDELFIPPRYTKNKKEVAI